MTGEPVVGQGWDGWAQDWLPLWGLQRDLDGWVSWGIYLFHLQDGGWRVHQRTDAQVTATESRLLGQGATWEEALRSAFGQPVTIFGRQYYPWVHTDRLTRYYPVGLTTIQRSVSVMLLRDIRSGLWEYGLTVYNTPEEALLAGARSVTEMRTRDMLDRLRSHNQFRQYLAAVLGPEYLSTRALVRV